MKKLKVVKTTAMIDTDGIRIDMKEELFDSEDVEHIDEAICTIRDHDSSIALPGLEWVRNMVAARVGVALRDEGTISYKDLRADDEET